MPSWQKKIEVWYQHACLKYVSNEKMTNQSLRERFKIEDHNYSMASGMIRDAIKDGVIKEDYPESKSRIMQVIFLFGLRILFEGYGRKLM